MTDKELLEYAAKAAGLYIQRSRMDDPINRDFLIRGEGIRNRYQKVYPWNPLTDDGDALRLAVKLGLLGQDGLFYGEKWRIDLLATDRNNATRRAIVRAAAEIGKQMK